MLQILAMYAFLLMAIDVLFINDRKPVNTRKSDSAELSRCTIPNTPELQNMKFSLLLQNQTLEMGSFVEDYGIMQIECKPRHVLTGPSNLICKHGEWDNKFPTCKVYCDGTFWRRLSLKAICDKNLNFFECPERIEPGTNVNMVCAFGYVRTPNTPQILKCQSNGRFDKNSLPCRQDCGRISTFSKTITKAATLNDGATIPWHVSIYDYFVYKYEYICSGSIISPRITITAAHCFWDKETSRLRENMKCHIVAGQSTKEFTSVNNEHAVLVTVEQIYLPQHYTGSEGNQKYDIAFLKLAIPLKYSETIAPICIPDALLNEDPARVIVSNTMGYVNSFGLINNLKKHEMTILTREDCIAKLPQYAIVADDKFCIHNNESSSLCIGDSGAGYYTDYLDPNTNKTTYRLLGVVSSFTVSRSRCIDRKSYAAITSILQIPEEFRMKLANARKQDEGLF